LFKIGIRAATGFVPPAGVDVRYDAAVPLVGQMLLEPSREGAQFFGSKLRHGGFEFW